MNLRKLLLDKQAELELGQQAFSKYLGCNRYWMTRFLSTYGTAPIQEKTMFKLHNKLGIPLDVMKAYNASVMANKVV